MAVSSGTDAAVKVGEFIHRRAGVLALLLNGLLCLGITISGLVYYNSRPHPAPESGLGSVAIDLKQLDHHLEFEDLQAAGMFTGLACGHCDFSRTRTRLHLREEDFTDIAFMGTLYLGRGRDELWLHFYGNDRPAGQRRLEAAMQDLRSRFPGYPQAFRQVGQAWGDVRGAVRRDQPAGVDASVGADPPGTRR